MCTCSRATIEDCARLNNAFRHSVGDTGPLSPPGQTRLHHLPPTSTPLPSSHASWLLTRQSSHVRAASKHDQLWHERQRLQHHRKNPQKTSSRVFVDVYREVTLTLVSKTERNTQMNQVRDTGIHPQGSAGLHGDALVSTFLQCNAWNLHLCVSEGI